MLLRSPWGSSFSEFLMEPEKFLLLASPFLTRSVAHWICDQLARTAQPHKLRIVCLTNLRMESLLNGSLELEGISELGKVTEDFIPIHLPALHAKVFIADYSAAIVTSGNLTQGGLERNYEYGVALRRPDLVRQIRDDFERYAELGARLTTDDIKRFASEIADLREEYIARERGILKKASAIFKSKVREAEERVLRFRAARSNQSIFCETIEYLLRRGPLRTEDLHPLIQRLHPDLCDDSIDRVIDGVSFGRKWKHLVRGAQQALKRKGRIAYDGSRWLLASPPSPR